VVKQSQCQTRKWGAIPAKKPGDSSRTWMILAIRLLIPYPMQPATLDEKKRTNKSASVYIQNMRSRP
jgi:hypothetical protein